MKIAILLTARKERDSEIPYPLIPFADGICLMDRTITILREFNYDRILVVTGYKHELFEKYKAEDVKVVVNPDFEFTASMGFTGVMQGYGGL